jgi:hypothetical protein
LNRVEIPLNWGESSLTSAVGQLNSDEGRLLNLRNLNNEENADLEDALMMHKLIDEDLISENV